jgi:hypothetical protein
MNALLYICYSLSVAFLLLPGASAQKLVSLNATAVLSGSPPSDLDLPDEILREALPRIVGGTVSPDNAYPWFGRTDVTITQFG